jgi:hypothetical protein
MSTLAFAACVFLGVPFTVFGLNGILQFIPVAGLELLRKVS